MASFRQVGQSAALNGVPAEVAVADSFRRDLTAEELGAGVSQFLDGFGVRTNPARAMLFERCVAAVRARGARDPRAVCASAGRRKYGQAEMTRRSVAGRRNPAEAAAEAFREFNGRDPELTVRVKAKRHHHKHLAGAGLLVRLIVAGVDGREHKIENFGGALLAFNEAKNQLFVEGGDQSINLADYRIKRPHEIETLGKVLKISYEGRKDHLGAEGGHAVYTHTFRTTNENGRHVVVKMARCPDLIYHRLDVQLEFSGGSYTIKREGIDL